MKEKEILFALIFIVEREIYIKAPSNTFDSKQKAALFIFKYEKSVELHIVH